LRVPSDLTLTCRVCGVAFPFTGGEQDFYARKGFTNGPSRCPECRADGNMSPAAGSSPGEGIAERQQELFAAECAQCAKAVAVPAFQFLGADPIYCPQCFAAHGGGANPSTDGWRDTW
jgi:CxxC-x17-CxxC domain-containing protein